jgi:MFS family permease
VPVRVPPSVGRFRRQLGVIGRSRGFRLLFFATLGSTIGTLLATVALVVDVKDRTDSGTWVGALLLAQWLPTVIVGLFFAPLLDRLSRRLTMVAADVVRAAVFCVLPFVDTADAIVALAVVVGFASGFFRPASYAGLPNLVDEDDLPAATSVLQTAENVTWAGVPVVAGVLVAAAGPHPAYWLNAASFVLSAVLLSAIPARLLQVAKAQSRGHLRDLRDGLVFVLRSRPLRAVLVAWTLALPAIAAINTTEVFLAKDSLDAGDFGYGLLFGSIGLGLAVGGFAAGTIVEQRPIAIVYGSAILVNAAAFALAAIAPNIWIAGGCCALGGVGNGATVVCNSLLVQRGAPDEVRGRAFTVIMSINYLAFAGGFVVGGLVVDRTGPRWVWGIASIVLACAGVAGYMLARGVASPRRAEPEPAV